MSLVFRNLGGGNPYSGLMQSASDAFGRVGRAYMGLGQAQFQANMKDAENKRRQQELEDARYNKSIDTTINLLGGAMKFSQQQDTLNFNKNLKLFGLEDAGLNTQLKMLKPSARQKVLEGRSRAINNIDSGEEFKLTENGLFGVTLGPDDYLPIKNKSEDIKNANTVYKDYLELQKEKRSKLERQYYEEHGYIDLNAGLVDGDGNPIDQPSWRFMDADMLKERKKEQGIPYPKGRYKGDLQGKEPETFFTKEEIPDIEKWLYTKGYRKPETFEDFTERTFGIRIPRRAGTPTVTVESGGGLGQDAKLLSGQYPEAVGREETQVAELESQGIGGIETELMNFAKENNLPAPKVNNQQARELEDWANNPSNKPGGALGNWVAEYGGKFMDWLTGETNPKAVARPYSGVSPESSEIEPTVNEQPSARYNITGQDQYDNPVNNAQRPERMQNAQSALDYSTSVEKLSRSNPNIVQEAKGANKGRSFAFTVAPDGRMDDVHREEAGKFIEDEYLSKFRKKTSDSDTASISTDDLIKARELFMSDAFKYHSKKEQDPYNVFSPVLQKKVDDTMAQYDSIISSIADQNSYQGSVIQNTQDDAVLPPLLSNMEASAVGDVDTTTFDNEFLVTDPPTRLMDTRSIIPDNETQSELESLVDAPILTPPEKPEFVFKGMTFSEGDNTKAFAENEKADEKEIQDTVPLDVSEPYNIVDKPDSPPTSKKGEAESVLNITKESEADVQTQAVILTNEMNKQQEVVYKGKTYNVEVPPEALMLFIDMEAKKINEKGKTFYHVNFSKMDGGSKSFGIGQMKETTFDNVNDARKRNGLTPITPEDFKTKSEAQLEATASYIKYIVYPECASKLGDKWDDLKPSEKIEVAYLRYNGALQWDPKEDKGWRYSSRRTAPQNHSNLRGRLEPLREDLDAGWESPNSLGNRIRGFFGIDTVQAGQ